LNFLSLQNKNLIVRPGVDLTDTIDPVISALDPYFEGRLAYVTSGLRTKEHQLDIIKQYAKLKGIAKEFPAVLSATLDAKTFFEGHAVFAWQPAWSRLLERGVIINPPVAASPLFDYVRNGKNLKGVVIMPSPHMRGTAFDIGGGSDGVEDERLIIALAIGKVAGLSGVLVERENNAIHVNCAKT
jgi:hypothetical protein